jgi:AcrR family transcriptional regulator
MRYKEYNVNNVLDKSIKLFWGNGFKGCSINELVKITGVNRFSLYHEFENKEGILYASIQLYRDRFCQEKLDLLKTDGNLKDILKEFYLSFLNETNPIPGCYIIHIATELADQDEKIKELVHDYLSDTEQLLVNLLQRKKISLENSVRLARHLVGLYCTVMSFCLVHTKEEREKHIENGMHVILNTYV